MAFDPADHFLLRPAGFPASPLPANQIVPEKKIVDSMTGDVIYDSRHPSAGPVRNRKVGGSHAKRATAGVVGPNIDLTLGALRSGTVIEKKRALKDVLLHSSLADLESLSRAVADLLASGNPEYYQDCLAALRHTGVWVAACPSLEAVLRSAPQEVVVSLLGVFEEQGSSAAPMAEAILQLLTKRGFPASLVVSTLRETGLSAGALSLLSKQLKAREYEKKIAALELATQVGTSASPLFPELLNLLDDTDDRISDRARRALLKVGFRDSGIAPIKRILRGGRADRQHALLDLLANYGSTARSVSPVIVGMLKTVDPGTLNRSLKTLLAIGVGEDCVNNLFELVYHPQHEKRQLALDLAVNRLPDDVLQPMMLKLMADRDAGLREQASGIFKRGHIGPTATEAVKRLLRDERVSVKLLVLDALKQMEGRARPVLKYILERIEDANTEVARAAANAFSQIGHDRQCNGDLDRVLSHRRQDRRLLVLHSLEKQAARAADALPLVARRLGDPDWIVREAARDAFIAIGFDESCMSEVRRLISHQDREFRLAAIRALGACGLSAAAAAAFLDARLNDDDAEVGRAARKALREVTQGIGGYSI